MNRRYLLSLLAAAAASQALPKPALADTDKVSAAVRKLHDICAIDVPVNDHQQFMKAEQHRLIHLIRSGEDDTFVLGKANIDRWLESAAGQRARQLVNDLLDHLTEQFPAGDPGQGTAFLNTLNRDSFKDLTEHDVRSLTDAVVPIAVMRSLLHSNVSRGIPIATIENFGRLSQKHADSLEVRTTFDGPTNFKINPWANDLRESLDYIWSGVGATVYEKFRTSTISSPETITQRVAEKLSAVRERLGMDEAEFMSSDPALTTCRYLELWKKAGPDDLLSYAEYVCPHQYPIPRFTYSPEEYASLVRSGLFEKDVEDYDKFVAQATVNGEIDASITIDTSSPVLPDGVDGAVIFQSFWMQSEGWREGTSLQAA